MSRPPPPRLSAPQAFLDWYRLRQDPVLGLMLIDPYCGLHGPVQLNVSYDMQVGGIVRDTCGA